MIIKIRNFVLGVLYRRLLKPLFFMRQPETVHDRMVAFGKNLGNYGITRAVTSTLFNYENSHLRQTICGIYFQNPLGLSAGFDKDACLPGILPCVGFGFEEVGSITAKPYAGNPGRWLYRLPEHRSLRVYYGLKNEGAEKIHARLAGKKFAFPLGISIAKTNSPETSAVENGIRDYLFTYKLFDGVGDYFTINISCPNTCEPKPIFAESQNLDLLLAALFALPKTKPVFIKLSPDLEEKQLLDILKLGSTYPVDGFVCSNLTKVNRFGHEGIGGFSGMAVQKLSDDLIAKVYAFYGGKKIIIGCGGVFSAADAYRKIKLGASLIQLITGMIYQGPQLISEINRELADMLNKDGYETVSQAVGTGL